jgi:hypothetical protein
MIFKFYFWKILVTKQSSTVTKQSFLILSTPLEDFFWRKNDRIEIDGRDKS